MPKYRVEVEGANGYQLLHGRVEARTADEAMAYIRMQLPRRCDGHRLRAKEVAKKQSTLMAAGAAEVHDG